MINMETRVFREAFQKKTRGKSENGIKGGGVSDLIHFFKFFQKNEKTLRRGGGKPSISFLLTSYWLLRKELFQLIYGKKSITVVLKIFYEGIIS